MIKYLWLLLVPTLAFGAPNGYFRYNRTNDTFEMIADTALLDEADLDTVQFDLNWSDGVEEGRLQWNNDDGTLEYGMPGGNVTLQIGLEMLVRVTNKTGSAITNGTAVYISGAQGSRPTIDRADSATYSKHHALGVATETIDNNASGFVASFGYVRSLDTSAWAAGTELYLDGASGALTNGIPAYPAEPVRMGVVLFSSADDGIIFVNPAHEITFNLLSTTPLKTHSLEFTATNLYNDLRFPVSTIDIAGILNPPDTTILSNSIYTLLFDNSGNEHLFFSAQMDHTYWNGTTLRPHMHIIETDVVQTSYWSLVYSKAEIGEVFGAPQTLTITNITSGTNGKHVLVNFGDMDGFTNGPSGMVGCEVKRLAGGSASDMQVIEFDIHYRVKYASGAEFSP